MRTGRFIWYFEVLPTTKYLYVTHTLGDGDDGIEGERIVMRHDKPFHLLTLDKQVQACAILGGTRAAQTMTPTPHQTYVQVSRERKRPVGTDILITSEVLQYNLCAILGIIPTIY